MRFEKRLQLPGAGRTRKWHYHGSDTPTFPKAIYVLKSAKGPNIFGGVYEKSYLSFKKWMPDRSSFWKESGSPTKISSRANMFCASMLSADKPRCSGDNVSSFQATIRFSKT